jgi:hypothetical protein
MVGPCFYTEETVVRFHHDAPILKKLINNHMNAVDQIKYYQMLLETRDAYLYHGTVAERAESILANNVLKAQTDFDEYGIDPRMNLKYAKKIGAQKTISVARDFYHAKHYAIGWYDLHDRDDSNFNLPCVLVLDQPRLRRDIGKRIRPAGRASRSTTEEKIYGDINGIRSYIVSILIYELDQVDDGGRYTVRDKTFEEAFAAIYPHIVKSGKAKFVK